MKTSEFETINEVVLQHANDNPDGLAYIFLQNGKEESERLTYQQLAAKSEALAMHLVKRGNFGDRVILMIPSSTNFMVAYLACLFAGQIPVPLPDPPFSSPADRLLPGKNSSGA